MPETKLAKLDRSTNAAVRAKKAVQLQNDKPLIAWVTVNSCLVLASLITVFSLRRHEFLVPIQYAIDNQGIGLIIHTGAWWTLYLLAVVVLAGLAVLILAINRVYTKSRFMAYGIAAVHSVVALQGLLAVRALIGLVSKV